MSVGSSTSRHAAQLLAHQEDAANQRDEQLRRIAQAEHARHELEMAKTKDLESARAEAAAATYEHRAELAEVQAALQRAVAEQSSALLRHEHEMSELRRGHEEQIAEMQASEQETSRAHAEEVSAHQDDAATRHEHQERGRREFERLMRKQLDDAKLAMRSVVSEHSAEIERIQDSLQRVEAEKASTILGHEREMDEMRAENEECIAQLIEVKDQMEVLKQENMLRVERGSAFYTALRAILRTRQRRRLEAFWSVWVRASTQDAISHAVWSVQREAHTAKQSHLHRLATLSRVRLIAVRIALVAKSSGFRAFERNSLTGAAMKASETIIGAALRQAGLLSGGGGGGAGGGAAGRGGGGGGGGGP